MKPVKLNGKPQQKLKNNIAVPVFLKTGVWYLTSKAMTTG